jgi:hypothetical protein
MNICRIELSRTARCLLVAAGAVLGSTSAVAVERTGAADAARYQRERAVCMSGQSNQDRATCLREAGAAFAQARREGLDDGAAAYARNARQRCEALPHDDRLGCLARMQGQGTTSGTAASGGISRELVTHEVIPPNTAMPQSRPPGEIAK